MVPLSWETADQLAGGHVSKTPPKPLLNLLLLQLSTILPPL
jgi:hypothetical protein